MCVCVCVCVYIYIYIYIKIFSMVGISFERLEIRSLLLFEEVFLCLFSDEETNCILTKQPVNSKTFSHLYLASLSTKPLSF